MKRKEKIFVLDTNIILHDYRCIWKFQDNDLIIPIAVLEELDKFKKGNDALNYNARGFIRELDRLTKDHPLGKEGVPIGEHYGDIKIELNHPFPPQIAGCFADDIPDHRILSTAIWVRDNNPDRFVALVTKDVNLRMKAKAVGMEAQDYLTDKVDEDKVEDIYLYFKEDAESDSLDAAVEELGADYTEEEIRLVRILFMCEQGH